MPSEQFACANPKCLYAIASEGLNSIQLQVLRRWPKTCPECGKQTKWTEQLPLLNTNTIKRKANGGLSNAKTNRKNNPGAH